MCSPERGVKQRLGMETGNFLTLCVDISKRERDTSILTIKD